MKPSKQETQKAAMREQSKNEPQTTAMRVGAKEEGKSKHVEMTFLINIPCQSNNFKKFKVYD